MNSFVHLNVQSHYSIMDGISSIRDLVDKCISDGMYAMALTDRDVMFGIKEFINYAKHINEKTSDSIAEISVQLQADNLTEKERTSLLQQIEELQKQYFKPIIGVKVHYVHQSQNESSDDCNDLRLILLAKNKNGYRNLCRLLSEAWLGNNAEQPRVDRALLEKYHDDLIVLADCSVNEDIQATENDLIWLKVIFKDDFYLEVRRYETKTSNGQCPDCEPMQNRDETLFRLAESTRTKVVATNNVRFAKKEYGETFEISTRLDVDKSHRTFTSNHHALQEWLKSPAEMKPLFADHPEALAHTQEVADKIEMYSIDSNPQLPKFSIPADFDSEADYLAKLVWDGAACRYQKLTEDIRTRITRELDYIDKVGCPGYFLIVQDYVNAARKMGALVGPGRGSTAGSIVAYCLGITDVDPLKYDLLFERFFTATPTFPLPDIVIDVDDKTRDEVINYLKEKYGHEHVAHIITFGTMTRRMAIEDVGQILDIPHAQIEELAKKPASELKESKLHAENKMIATLLCHAEILKDTLRNRGIHACGIVIGADKLSETVPLCTIKDYASDEMLTVTQYDEEEVETAGLVKLDLPGLRSLSAMKRTLSNIKTMRGEDLDVNSIPLDDTKTLELFCSGDTSGIFQFENPEIQEILQELRPSTFEDLVALSTLHRPGAMDIIPAFIARKHGREPIDYDLPEIKEYLHETYGLTVYQEQLMLLAQRLADFTPTESNQLRKAMGKKVIAKLNLLKSEFIKRGTEKGHDAASLEKIWKDWYEVSPYLFNKSHAVCYTLISYRMAYLKTHYPTEFESI